MLDLFSLLNWCPLSQLTATTRHHSDPVLCRFPPIVRRAVDRPEREMPSRCALLRITSGRWSLRLSTPVGVLPRAATSAFSVRPSTTADPFAACISDVPCAALW
jgi:hypothetical protein